MGTSKGYSAPGSWGPLKAEVTRAARAGVASSQTAAGIVAHFVRQNGGARGMARGGGSGGTIGGAAGRAVAQRLGAFVTSVGEVGLDQALRQEGLSDFVGRPIHEILAALLDHIGGPSSTVDDVDARTALARLQENCLAEAKDADDVEHILHATVDDLDGFLARYFGFYLFEQFCRVFFERLVQRVGQTKALSFLKDIEQFIAASVTNRLRSRQAGAIDWAGAEGSRVCSEIMETTLEVFAS